MVAVNTHWLWIVIGVCLFDGFRLIRLGVKEFGVVFGNLGFNARGAKDQVDCLLFADLLADGLGHIHQMLDHSYYVVSVVLVEPSDLRQVGHLSEATQLPKLTVAFQHVEHLCILRKTE